MPPDGLMCGLKRYSLSKSSKERIYPLRGICIDPRHAMIRFSYGIGHIRLCGLYHLVVNRIRKRLYNRTYIQTIENLPPVVLHGVGGDRYFLCDLMD